MNEPDHKRTNFSCCVYHGDGHGACIKCTCGEWVRPQDWNDHVLQMTPDERAQVEYDGSRRER